MSASSAEARALRRSWLPWLPLLVVLALALAVGSLGERPPATDADRVFAIASMMRCPICNGETAAESNTEISLNIREEIALRIKQGQSDDEIKAYLIGRYEGYQLTPPSAGVAGLVWALPVVALALSLAGLAVAFRRWGQPVDHRATAADRDLVERALADAFRSRTSTEQDS